MTTTEKAKEVIEKFNTIFGVQSIMWRSVVKQHALICVDEIIASSPSLPILSDNGSFGSDIEESTEWWKEVKKEIVNYKLTF